ncbi:MAG: polysaccharide biosynthesis protein [Alphaproteobacteria bacterium]|nr:polysaccharide biosynthesis protein [Alphaproteobacteria bacterium]
MTTRRWPGRRALVVALLDATLAGLAYLVSFYLRVGDAILTWPSQALWGGVLLFVAIAAGVSQAFGLSRRVWRYAGLDDVAAIGKVVVLTHLVFLPALFLVTRLQDFPRSVLVIDLFVMAAFLVTPRLLTRVLRERRFGGVLEREGRRVPVLLVGWGDAAEAFVRNLARGDGAPYRVVGVVDDRADWQGRQVLGVEVLGREAALESVVEQLAGRDQRPERLVLGRTEDDGAHVRGLVELAGKLALPVSRLPDPRRLEQAGTSKSEIRPIEVEDLLGRPQRVLDRSGLERLVSGRRILVTGAGGTIGGELVRQIAALAPAHLALLDNAEYPLYLIDLEMTERWPRLSRAAILGDVRDRLRIDQILARERPDLVFHAAAFKHLPLVEVNPNEGVLTNVAGTRVVADAAAAAGVAAMVLISTDKAVNPTSVMGASKRLAEIYCQALDVAALGKSGTRFVTVRFGNVLGSTGSVVPLFRRQIAAGGPLTVTDPEVTRYFMTVREAVELVLQACELALSQPRNEPGAIHVLEMGEPVKILDLARQMIRLAGLRPGEDIQIVFSGLKPGEKLAEELFHGQEGPVATERPGILLARPRTVDLAILARALDEIEETARQRRTADTLSLLGRLVPEYQRAPPTKDRRAERA